MKTILIVEDEFDILSALKMIFTLEQYQILTASNGQLALQMMATRRPDLVLTDWMMPEMDGAELCHRMKADPALAGIPIIMMSAGLSAPQGSRLWNRFLSKPVEIEDLLALVEQYLTTA